MIMNIPFHQLKSHHLFTAAHVLGFVSTLLTYTGTHNVWLALAVAFLCLTLHTLAIATVWQVAETIQSAHEETPLDHRKVTMPEPRRFSGDRFMRPGHCNTGHTLPQVLCCIVAIFGAHALLVIGYLITCAVFGAQEPRW